MEEKEKAPSLGFAIHNACVSSVKQHSHRHLELAYLERGMLEHSINGQMQILQAGQYFIVDHGSAHAYRRISEERIKVRNFMFYPEFLDRSLKSSSRFQDVMRSYLLRFCYQTLRSDPTGIPFSDTDGRIHALLDTIESEYDSKGYGYVEYIRCALVEVLILTARKIGQQPSQNIKSQVVQELKAYADAHYAEPVRLKDAAAALGYCVPYLSQKFAAEMGIGFTDYLHQLRLQQGCHLLESTDLTVAQIAEKVGYDGAKYFTQIFKQQLATTPGKFRAAYKKAT